MLDSGIGTVTAPSALALGSPSVNRDERSAAISADENALASVSFASTWEQLETRIVEIVDEFMTTERCYLVVRQRNGPLNPCTWRYGYRQREHEKTRK
jgi:hypothetical protein